MKALTVHQPWAQLIALGVKTIETRSWSTRYRGPLAIHAAAKLPAEGMEVGRWTVERWRDEPTLPCLIGGGTARTPGSVMNPIDLPLGAIVATCTLVDVVPMVEGIPPQGEWREPWRLLTLSPWPILTSWRGFGSAEAERVYADQRPYGDFAPGRYAWLLDDVKPTTDTCPACGVIGLYVQQGVTPEQAATCSYCTGTGRCDPIPAKGRQGLWGWAP